MNLCSENYLLSQWRLHFPQFHRCNCSFCYNVHFWRNLKELQCPHKIILKNDLTTRPEQHFIWLNVMICIINVPDIRYSKAQLSTSTEVPSSQIRSSELIFFLAPSQNSPSTSAWRFIASIIGCIADKVLAVASLPPPARHACDACGQGLFT